MAALHLVLGFVFFYVSAGIGIAIGDYMDGPNGEFRHDVVFNGEFSAVMNFVARIFTWPEYVQATRAFRGLDDYDDEFPNLAAVYIIGILSFIITATVWFYQFLFSRNKTTRS